MQNPGYLPIGADRHTACFRTLEFLATDLTGATFALHVRAQKEAGGAALIDLANTASTSADGVRIIYGGTDTVANHIAAGRLAVVPDGYTSASSLALSLIAIQVTEVTIEAVAAPSPAESDLTLAWDIHVTPSGGIKERWLYGPFVIRAGVTR